MQDEEFQANLGIDRRTLIKRGAVVGGTLVWAAPVVQSLSAPAFAAGSPQPACTVTTRIYDPQSNTCTITNFNADTDCCECVNAGNCSGDPCSDRQQVGPSVTQPGQCPTG